ncbi:MAG TPA: vanadium-dependent haloperoxidase [Candidatus Dormibacteraeota bacterium]
MRVIRALLLAIMLTVAPTAPPASADSPATSSQIALDWNLNAVNAVRAARTMDGVAPGSTPRLLYQAEGLVYMSYVQAAEYDAVMKISHRYLLYHHFEAAAGHASVEAALVAAAYNTLVFYLGDSGGVLAAKYSSAIAALPADEETMRGISVGEAAAADIEQLRANDGRNSPVSDSCPRTTTAGVWQCAPPPSVQTEQTPWLATMQPFMLIDSSQFRAPAPPAIDSTQFLTERDETRDLGAAASTVRTPDQTSIATFWNANAVSLYGKTLRDAAIQYNLDLVDTVRLMAAGIMVSTDAGIACFDSKYHYRFWRPITAIRADGEPADATWSPLLTTPNHPEYPAQHGCATSSFMQAIAATLGTNNFNLTIFGAPVTGTALVPRVYGTPQQVDHDIQIARVAGGLHYRNSVVQGQNLGHSVATWTLDRFFLPGDD